LAYHYNINKQRTGI